MRQLIKGIKCINSRYLEIPVLEIEDGSFSRVMPGELRRFWKKRNHPLSLNPLAAAHIPTCIRVLDNLHGFFVSNLRSKPFG